MTRNLKVTLAAAMVVVALGAMTASVAQAVTPATFTAPGAVGEETTTLRVLPDEVVGTKTAHQVFDIRKPDGTGVLSITCNTVRENRDAFGNPVHSHIIGSQSEDATVTPIFEGACNFAGQFVTVANTGCIFTFTPGSPQLHIASDTGAVCKKSNKPIHFENPVLGCKVEVGEQTIGNGIAYHNIAGGLLTLEAKEVQGVNYNATGAGCPYGELNNGLYTTGSSIITGERGGKMVEVKWDAAV